MTKFRGALSSSAFTPLLVLVTMSAATAAGDLSKYRDFQLGTDLPTVAKQIGASPSQAKLIHRRPLLIQELQWRPQPLGPSSGAEAAQEVVFSFCDGALYRIVVSYDRHATEGLTNDDIVDAISAAYGPAAKTTAPAKAKTLREPYTDQEAVVARWQDPQYRFELIRSSYGPSFQLIGVLKRLEAPVEAAIVEAKRLDIQEAPQRDADRVASEEEASKAKLDKARLVNKPNFRP
jgi:hypothetical protein